MCALFASFLYEPDEYVMGKQVYRLQFIHLSVTFEIIEWIFIKTGIKTAVLLRSQNMEDIHACMKCEVFTTVKMWNVVLQVVTIVSEVHIFKIEFF